MTSETDKDETVIPLVAETARVDRVQRETGRVRVHLRTETVEEEVRETLRGEAVAVERVPVNRTLAEGEAAPQPRQDAAGDWIIPVVEEVLVVERRLVLREEIHLRRRTTEDEIHEVVALRRQRADVERLPPEG